MQTYTIIAGKSSLEIDVDKIVSKCNGNMIDRLEKENFFYPYGRLKVKIQQI